MSPVNIGDDEHKYASSPQLDEYGTTGVDGLYKGWGGQPREAPVREPKQGTNIYWREYDRMLPILNTGNDNAGAPTTVIVANLPGGADEWERFLGTQNPAKNNGQPVTENFSLGQASGIVLRRRT
jgi:hypothetical protein